MGKAATFVNGEFKYVTKFETHPEAVAFARGFNLAADYSSGDHYSLVWPDHEAEIRECDAAQDKGVLAALEVR